MQQQPILYNLRCEADHSMFDLRDVVVYLTKRVGTVSGRIWFGGGMAINAQLTATQRSAFMRFLVRHKLDGMLTLDDYYKDRRPRWRPGARKARL